MIQKGQIRAVTFDVGGTLIEPWPSVGHVYAEVAAKHGVPAVDVPTLNQGFSKAWKARRDFNYTQEAWFGLVRETFGDLAAALPEDFFPAVYQRFAEADAWQIYEDALPALDQLASRGLAIGIVSNWDERLRPLLQALRLHSYFEAVIVSHDIGFTKPSPVIFEQALRKLGLPPEAVLHVGDGRSEDYDGACGAGMSAVLLDRRAASGDHTVASLKELPALLA